MNNKELPSEGDWEHRVKSAADFWETYIKPKMTAVPAGSRRQCLHWHILWTLFDTDADVEQKESMP
ncbi:MAG: hypothetical protein ABIL00_05175 [candidate division WOR-3 bacterium]